MNERPDYGVSLMSRNIRYSFIRLTTGLATFDPNGEETMATNHKSNGERDCINGLERFGKMEGRFFLLTTDYAVRTETREEF